MTKSAKQGTTKAVAEQAEQESAATETTDVATAEDAAGARSGDSATADDSAKAADTAEPPAEPAPADGAKPELDDVKRKFREALDRKKQFHSEGQGKGAHDSGKVNGAHGPAASRRNFRRKSG